MTPIDWATRPLQKYADFTGRAPRAEYWWFVLLYMVGFVVATIIDSVLGLDAMALTYGPVTILFALAILVPSLAVGARRLHDTDRSGWWLLMPGLPYLLGIALVFGGAASGNSMLAMLGGALAFVGFICGIVLLVWFCTKGTDGPNRFGDDPLADPAEDLAQTFE